MPNHFSSSCLKNLYSFFFLPVCASVWLWCPVLWRIPIHYSPPVGILFFFYCDPFFSHIWCLFWKTFHSRPQHTTKNSFHLSFWFLFNIKLVILFVFHEIFTRQNVCFFFLLHFSSRTFYILRHFPVLKFFWEITNPCLYNNFKKIQIFFLAYFIIVIEKFFF